MWASFRDKELKNAVREAEGKTYRLYQCDGDPQLWKVCADGPHGQPGPTEAHILVYVDDLLMVGQTCATKGFAKWVSEKWECQTPDWLGEGYDTVRFLGMEISKGAKNEIMISQRAFIDELLRGHDYQGAPTPAMASREALLLTETEEMELLESPEDVSDDTPAVRKAQRRGRSPRPSCQPPQSSRGVDLSQGRLGNLPHRHRNHSNDQNDHVDTR